MLIGTCLSVTTNSVFAKLILLTNLALPQNIHRHVTRWQHVVKFFGISQLIPNYGTVQIIAVFTGVFAHPLVLFGRNEFSSAV